jgi:ribose transport system substrate-binding protein
MRQISTILLVIGLSGFLLGGCTCSDAPLQRISDTEARDKALEDAKPKPPEPAALRVAAIPRTAASSFWRGVNQGLIKATTEFSGLKIPPWTGLDIAGSPTAQAAAVESAIQQQVKGIIVAPVDGKSLALSAEAARKAGIPLVLVDTALEDEQLYAALVTSENRKAGQLAAARLLKQMPAGGRVFLFREQDGGSSAAEREQAFLEEVGRHPELKVASSDTRSGATAGEATLAAGDLIKKFNLKLSDAVFCSGGIATQGMFRALQEANLLGDIEVVGCDVTQELYDALRNEEIDALILQDPARIGHEAAKALMARLRGQPVAKRIEIPVTLVTFDDLARPEVLRLILAQKGG